MVGGMGACATQAVGVVLTMRCVSVGDSECNWRNSQGVIDSNVGSVVV